MVKLSVINKYLDLSKCLDALRHVAHWGKVGEPVPSEIAIPSENFVTIATWKWLLFGVREQVGLEVRALIESFSTWWTSVGTLLHMEDPMDSKCPRLAKTLAAIFAFERFLFGVDVSVVSQVVLSSVKENNILKTVHCENQFGGQWEAKYLYTSGSIGLPKSFSANITVEWTLVGVRPLVNEKVVGLGEFSAAIFANVFLLLPFAETRWLATIIDFAFGWWGWWRFLLLLCQCLFTIWRLVENRIDGHQGRAIHFNLILFWFLETDDSFWSLLLWLFLLLFLLWNWDFIRVELCLRGINTVGRRCRRIDICIGR